MPNRIDASLFPIDKTGKMNSDGGKTEGKDFSVEIKPGGFVYSDGRSVEEDVFVEVTAFLNSEDEFLDAFPGEFRGTRENGSETAIESFGFIDVVLKVKSGEPVQLADGVTATIKIKAPENSPTTIPMWHYDEDKAQWIEEGVGKLDNGFYTAEVSHFTKWNWDRPYDETSKIIGRVVDNSGNPIEGASVVQKGITYKFQNSAKTNAEGEFELLTPESNESEIEAYFDIYGSTIINYTTSPNKGQVNNVGDIKIDVSVDNIIPPFISSNVLYITIGQTTKIRGKYFGEEKRAGYKLLLNGNEVATKTWENDLIEFVVPNGIAEEGVIQIDRDGVLSREVNYKEGDWTCEIKGDIYDNNNQLTYLYLSNRILIHLPNCIGNLQNLKELHLSNNRLSSLPESFGNLRNLQELDLHYNDLTSLPKSFSNLRNLRLLDLHSNPLSSLPESIGNLQNLRELDLTLTSINSLPENIVNLQNLEILNLENNDFVILSKSIVNLQNLKTLNLKSNDLTSLPESIDNLQNLKVLELGYNQLYSLSESIGNLQNLEELWLRGNLLTTLPENIGNLQSLESITLERNQLSSLPESIKNLKENLNFLNLGDNNFSEEEKAKVEEWLPNTDIRW